MLDQMRAFASTWPARILIGVLIVGLSVWGISNVFINLGSTTVARVGDQEISVREFQRAYIGQVNAYAAQTGRQPTVEEAIQLGIPSVALQQLATSASIDGLAQDFGMGASDNLVADEVASDPTFARQVGGFDREQFNAVLRQNGWTEAEYLDAQSRSIQRNHINAALFPGMPPPDAMLEITGRYQTDVRTLEYVTLGPGSIPAIEAPTDEELQAYLEANQSRYRTAEMRTIRVLPLTPQIYADTLEIGDEELRAEYERTASRYVEPEKRTIATLALPAPATANWFNFSANAGKPFAEALETAGLGDGVTELGTLAQAEIEDEALASIAFGLEPGEYAVIGDGDNLRLVYVSAVDPGGQMSFEDVRDRVRATLALERADDALDDVVDAIEEMRAGLSPVETAASAYALDTVEVTTDATGASLEAIDALPEDARVRFLQAVFAAEPGGLVPAFPVGGDTTIWFDVVSVEPARDQTLDEAREALVTDWTAERTAEALDARAAELAGRIESGESIDDVATEIGSFTQISIPITRAGDGFTIDAAVAAAAFQGGVGHTGYARNGDGDYLVFQVADVQPGDIAQAQDGLEAGIGNALNTTVTRAFVEALGNDRGFVINQQTLNNVLTNTLGAQ